MNDSGSGKSFTESTVERGDLVEILRLRSEILREVREFFHENEFVEVTTPSLLASADPATHLDSFETSLHLVTGGSRRLFLPTSPEYHMKRLVAAGMNFIYQICPFFRNGEMSSLHNPDFIGLEWYATGCSYHEMMDFTEELVRHVARQALGTDKVDRCGLDIKLGQPFLRISLYRALREIGGIEVDETFDYVSMRAAIEAAGIAAAEDDRFDDLVNRALIERVEPEIRKMGPVFLYDYPLPMAALARSCPGKPWLAERFELYAGGLELCNGYGELTDAREQRRRFETQRDQRRQDGRYVPDVDESFLEALASGIPDCSGCAMGIDRLVMLLAGKKSIHQVVPFPLELELGETRAE